MRVGRVPLIANVGCLLFVVACRGDRGDEAVCFVKPSGSKIALKRPEFESRRTKPHRTCEQRPADALPCRIRIDIGSWFIQSSSSTISPTTSP